MEARFWSPKSSSFSGSDSIVVEEAAKKLPSPRPSVNRSGAPNFFIQHDKVDEHPQRLYYLLTRHAVRPTGKASNIIR